jgi:hypothetical protein
MPIALPTRADNEPASHEKTLGKTRPGEAGWQTPVARQPVGDTATACRLDDAVCNSNPSSARELNRYGGDASLTLTWRVLGGAALPLALLVASGQGRQLRMLAPYTTRRLPSASLRCSWGISIWSAGHRSVPSGWRAKSWPEKRPAFQGSLREEEHTS